MYICAYAAAEEAAAEGAGGGVSVRRLPFPSPPRNQVSGCYNLPQWAFTMREKVPTVTPTPQTLDQGAKAIQSPPPPLADCTPPSPSRNHYLCLVASLSPSLSPFTHKPKHTVLPI